MSATQWTRFLDKALATRLDADVFADYVQILASEHPVSPAFISDLFLRPTEHNAGVLDMRIPRYVLSMLTLELVTVPSLLKALHRYTTFGTQAETHGTSNREDWEEKEKVRRWRDSFSPDETLLYRLAKHISTGSSPLDVQQAVELILVSIQWMDLVALASSAQHEMLNLASQETTAWMAAAAMALGTLLVAVVDNACVLQALSKNSVPKGTGKQLSKTLANFVPLLLQSSPQSAARLELFRTQTLVGMPLVKVDEEERKEVEASKEIDAMLDEELGLGIESLVVADLPVLNSRAGLYVHLNSLLVARPLIDDNAIFAYLNNRYQGDFQSMAVDLILASFDILANATSRSERSQTTTLLRSFLINKVPLLLTTLSASFFPPLTSEYCITAALNRVDTNAFPTLSNMFDETSSSNFMSDSVRQDFCFACCLHGLLEESSIEALLGDIPMQNLPAEGRLEKDVLVQQCSSDLEKAEGMIDELEHMDGNVGAVSQAITEVIGRLCSNKETMTLKTLCSLLARKPSSLDIILLFDKPVTILQPICDLLDNWRYDEDQGEYQPVYEEFGSILLVVLSFTHRYNLTPIDLGLRSPSSFMSKLLTQGNLSRTMENLTNLESSHLDGWIRGLFDNESGGLGDELMSACPPQDFYLLVPTLFHHIILACSTNNLNEEALKGGLEYLVDTFLLPSLIPGITWLSAHLWESRGDANAVLQVLGALITNPTSISNNTEASAMLNAILNIIAKNLEQSLRYLQHAEPKRQDVEPLLKALRGNLGWERRGASEHTELESWTSGGLALSIRHTISSLLEWGSLNPLSSHSPPASYTHRQMLVGLRILGAKQLLKVIVDEVKSQTEMGNGSLAIEIASALICAPDAASWDPTPAIDLMGQDQMQPLQRRLTLREVLKMEADNASKVHKTDVFQAETVVRLYRRVEALCMPAIDAGLHDAALDAAMVGADANLLGDPLDVGMGDMGGEDLMSGLMGGGESMGGDLMEGFGSDGMGDLAF